MITRQTAKESLAEAVKNDKRLEVQALPDNAKVQDMMISYLAKLPDAMRYYEAPEKDKENMGGYANLYIHIANNLFREHPGNDRVLQLLKTDPSFQKRVAAIAAIRGYGISDTNGYGTIAGNFNPSWA